jgi:hypothetical protein
VASGRTANLVNKAAVTTTTTDTDLTNNVYTSELPGGDQRGLVGDEDSYGFGECGPGDGRKTGDLHDRREEQRTE